jgi:transcriptional regulator with XRE-family HTH domain
MLSNGEHTRLCIAALDDSAETSPASRQEFCRALKAARERRGITLAEIAEATKVCPSHFAALERNDLRLWPKGLFRRAFFRGYAGMVGLPVAETLDEFIRLFPDDGTPPSPTRSVSDASALRMVLDSSWHGPRAPLLSRLAAALLDGVVIAAAIALAWRAGQDVAITSAVVVASYFTLATIIFGTTPAGWAIQRRRLPRPTSPEPVSDAPEPSFAARAWRRSVEVVTFALGKADGDAGPDFGVSDDHYWVSNARRVEPREIAPRWRVRIKWSP